MRKKREKRREGERLTKYRCDACKKTKTACSGGERCAGCVKKKVRCTYPEGRGNVIVSRG